MMQMIIINVTMLMIHIDGDESYNDDDEKL